MLIDSNILIYAINASSPKHEVAQLFLQKNIGELIVAHQNIFETLRVLTHPKFPNPMSIEEAIAALDAILISCTIIAPDYATHQITIKLIQKYSLNSNQVFDAYLIATALSNDVQTIASDNLKDLKVFTEISIISPF